LQEYESNALVSTHLELWFLVHVWNLTDKIFNDIEGMEAVRGESCSLSSSARKNRERTAAAVVDMKRKIFGRRGDLN
ncbi:8303_t:CDS:2, partial [Ambispora gerdemannii]